VSLNHISPGVRRFVAEHINSVMQLELLLFLHRDPAHAWSAEELAREMRLPTGWTTTQLERFRSHDLLVGSGRSELEFRYRADNASASVIDEVAETFRSRPTSMTALIFSPSR
jgi:hypothetical protein